MSGQEAVISTLGAPPSDKTMVCADGTRNIIRAMEQAGIRRFICQTSLGFGDSRALLPFYMKYLIVPLILRRAFADHERQESYMKQSRLDWIIVCPGNLNVQAPIDMSLGTQIRRSNLKSRAPMWPTFCCNS